MDFNAKMKMKSRQDAKFESKRKYCRQPKIFQEDYIASLAEIQYFKAIDDEQYQYDEIRYRVMCLFFVEMN